MVVFCGTDGRFCSVGCQVRGEHRDWALTSPWVAIEQTEPKRLLTQMAGRNEGRTLVE
jgi:hypothetical protein